MKSKTLNWIIKRHWYFIGLLIIFLLSLEFFDVIQHQHGPIHTIEFTIYLILLLLMGSLLDSLLKIINTRTKLMKIIDYKHQLSLEFSVYHDWDVLVSQMTRFPSTIALVDKTSLFVRDSLSNQLELAGQWPETGEPVTDLRAMAALQRRLEENPDFCVTFQQCNADHLSQEIFSQNEVFVLPIQYGKRLLGIIQFKLKEGESLSSDQKDIFTHVGDEFAFVLKAAQERKKYNEMTASETALAERRRVSLYLHDHLGHNLSYLHFKLDQLVSMENEISLETMVSDLKHMRKAAQESYEIVRGTLETLRPETTPVLTNLLLEHARNMSKRANLEIDFKTKGKPAPLPVEVNRAIFYVFEEALSNTEKYAQASKVNVLAEWSRDSFALTISDNGVSFDPESVNIDHHFGLEILRERMQQVNGQVTLHTSKNSGTTVLVQVPQVPVYQLGENS